MKRLLVLFVGAALAAGARVKAPEFSKMTRAIRLVGPLDEEQKARLLKVAEACPVHKTLSGKIEIVSKLV